MVEVFKTDVYCPNAAQGLLAQLHEHFGTYKANFDLDDCDQILRVVCPLGPVNAAAIIELLKSNGFYAEVLPDEPPLNLKLPTALSLLLS